MTGASERQNRGPRENHRATGNGAERATLRHLYAAKIAGARLYADRHQLAAIIAALRSEERAALNALQAHQAVKAWQSRNVRARASGRARPWWPYRRRKKGGARVAVSLK